jgi:ComF family protein
MRVLSLFINSLTDYLFPRSAEEEAFLVRSAADLWQKLPHAALVSREAHALFEYAHREVKEMIWRVKYRGDRATAQKLGTLLYDALVAELEEEELVEKYGPPLIVPMPVSPERRLARGFNQAELLAEALVACDPRRALAYAPQALRKTRHTESQTKTEGRAARLMNLKHSMAAGDLVAGRLVVVVDDVYTTGATCAEAKRALSEASAKKVLCLAVAH